MEDWEEPVEEPGKRAAVTPPLWVSCTILSSGLMAASTGMLGPSRDTAPRGLADSCIPPPLDMLALKPGCRGRQSEPPYPQEVGGPPPDLALSTSLSELRARGTLHTRSQVKERFRRRPLVVLGETPNPLSTGASAISQGAVLVLRDNVHRHARAGRGPLELVPVPPDWVLLSGSSGERAHS